MRNHDFLFDHTQRRLGIVEKNCTYDDGVAHSEPLPNKDSYLKWVNEEYGKEQTHFGFIPDETY